MLQKDIVLYIYIYFLEKTEKKCFCYTKYQMSVTKLLGYNFGVWQVTIATNYTPQK